MYTYFCGLVYGKLEGSPNGLLKSEAILDGSLDEAIQAFCRFFRWIIKYIFYIITYFIIQGVKLNISNGVMV